jgi:hypothetical protein
MSNLTRTNALTRSVLAAISGKKGSRLEEERPEELEEDENAEGTEDDTSAEDDVTDPDAEAEEEDTSAETDEEQTDEGKTTSASAIRRAEQGRIRSILTHPKADANAGLAAELAFGPKFYSAKDAGALLSAMGGGGGQLAGRMAGKSPKLGAGTPGAGKSTERQAVVAGVKNTIQAMHGRNRKGA